MLIPAEVWGRPQWDFEQRGFDPQLSYVEKENKFLFDPFLVLQNGSWESCPCRPGTLLTLAGNGFAAGAGRSEDGRRELGGVRVLVDGREAPLFYVTPAQVDFLLPLDARPPSASIAVLRGGRVLGKDSVLVRGAAGPRRASVAIGGDSVVLSTSGARDVSVHLLTTPLPFRASFLARIDTQTEDAVPLRVMLWNPRNFSSFEVVFQPDGRIEGLFVESRGKVAGRHDLGSYGAGEPVEIGVEWKRGTSAALFVTGRGGRRSASVAPAGAPALFDAYRPSLTVVSAAHSGAASVTLSDYRLRLYPYRFATVRVDSPIIPPLTGGIALAALALLAPALPVSAGGRRTLSRRWAGLWAGRGGRTGRAGGLRPGGVARRAAVALGIGALLAVNAALFPLGRQPFDMAGQEIWSYLAATYDLSELYYRSETATLAGVWRGVPYHEAIFPYGPGMSYYFLLAGKLHLLLFGDAAPSASLEYTIKAFNLAFLLIDGLLVYALVRTIRPSSRSAPWACAGIVLVSPALVFDTSIHGETDSFLLALLFASLLSACGTGRCWPGASLRRRFSPSRRPRCPRC